MNMVKAISLWQPWALLCVLGLKQYETRHWSTAFRGTLVIHAAKRWTYEEEAYLLRFIDLYRLQSYAPLIALQRAGKQSRWLGAALGTVQLTAIYRTELLVPKISEQERAFGNYEAGRYAWRLENPVLFAEPLPYRGEQGMWTWQLPLPESAAS